VPVQINTMKLSRTAMVLMNSRPTLYILAGMYTGYRPRPKLSQYMTAISKRVQIVFCSLSLLRVEA